MVYSFSSRIFNVFDTLFFYFAIRKNYRNNIACVAGLAAESVVIGGEEPISWHFDSILMLHFRGQDPP